MTGAWLPFGMPEGELQLFCLPHAGGSASAYRSWIGRMPGVAVCPLQPAGRETRLREAPVRSMPELVCQLADVLQAAVRGPYAVYGHSLGSLVGFELLRELRRRDVPPAVQLFVSGSPAPDRDDNDGPPVEHMSTDEVVQLLRELGGTPEWLLSDPTAVQMIVPPFQGDFTLKENYAYADEAPLDCPITAIVSTDDPRADRAMMQRWREHTSRRFRLHELVGGHFAVLENSTRTTGIVHAALSPWLPAGAENPDESMLVGVRR